MNADQIGELVNAAIPFLGGLYAVLLGYGLVGKQPGVGAGDPHELRRQRARGVLRTLGPILMMFGLFMLLRFCLTL